jgi:hypothetical protein
MNAANDSARWVDDLSALWTDPALEMLKASGVQGPSVPMELETWQSLKETMQLALCRQQGLPSTPMPIGIFVQQVVLAAVLRVARKFAPEFDALTLEFRLRPWVRHFKLLASAYSVYLQLIRSMAAMRTGQPLSRTGQFACLSTVNA